MPGKGLSIRLRLTLWHTGVLLIILTLFCLGSFALMRGRLAAESRRRLESGLTGVETVLRSSRGDLSDIYHLGQEPIFQLVRNGRVIYQTLSWQDTFGSGAPPPEEFAESGSWRSPRGAVYRLKSGRDADSNIDVYFAEDVTSTSASTRSLAIILAAGIPFALVLAFLGGLFLAGRALTPVRAITRKAGEINAENLSERLPVRNPDDEIGRLTSVFNETLGRLEDSFRRLQRFTSDASHELRTPLTSIRSVGEVALQGKADAQSCREAIGSMLEETERLARLTDSLLTLARGDAGAAAPAPRLMELGGLAGEVVEEMGVLAEEKNQELISDFQPGVMIMADRTTLRQALANVLHNAIIHAPEGGHIEIRTARSKEGRAIIDITDDGPGIDRSERLRVFERFYRVRGARAGRDGGAGLGLAIARWAVEANGGKIEFLDKEGRGAFCRISLPGRMNSPGD